jgi:hypothetical protein
MLKRVVFRYGASKWTAESINRLEDISSLTKKENDVRLQALKFSIENIKQNAEAWDEKSIFPKDTLRQAAKLGYSTLFIG